MLRLQGNGWFMPAMTAPIPGRWQGWAALAVFLVALAASASVPGETGWLVRIALAAAYFGLAFWCAGGEQP